MKYLFINSVAGYGSTGKIAADKCRELGKQGHECVLAYGRIKQNCDDVSTYRIGTKIDYQIHGLLTRLFDLHGFCSSRATRKFLKWADAYNPDIVWLHNIHGYYINVELLFEWMKQHPEKKYYWTLHDCWAMTGHCSHFSYVKCEQWRNQCGEKKCPQISQYPRSFCSKNVFSNYVRKKKAFTGVKNLTIVVPSKWLAELVRQSYLGTYKTEVCYNQIDKRIFKPTESEFRLKYHLQSKVIILGVANVWNDRKGLSDFINLRNVLDNNYTIVLVGLSKKQIKKMPSGIIGIERTADQHELAQIYTAADLYLNLSREETFGLTTIEAQACGTKAIVYENTACAEVIDIKMGNVIKQDINSLYLCLKGFKYKVEDKM